MDFNERIDHSSALFFHPNSCVFCLAGLGDKIHLLWQEKWQIELIAAVIYLVLLYRVCRPRVRVQDHPDCASRVYIKDLDGFIGATAQNYIWIICQRNNKQQLLVKTIFFKIQGENKRIQEWNPLIAEKQVICCALSWWKIFTNLYLLFVWYLHTKVVSLLQRGWKVALEKKNLRSDLRWVDLYHSRVNGFGARPRRKYRGSSC